MSHALNHPSLITFRTRNSFERVPNAMDVAEGFRPIATAFDHGSVDRALRRASGRFRAASVFPSAANLGLSGRRNENYQALEHRLGLSRTYKAVVGDRGRIDEVVNALRDLDEIESVSRVPLSFAPLAAASPAARSGARKEGAERPDARETAALTRAEREAAFRMVRAEEALQREPGSESVRVAVVDTGVALGHPEFQGKLLSGYDTVDLGSGLIAEDLEVVGDAGARDFTPMDEVNHGSHVAGIIGARGWRLPRGLGGACLILPMRVLGAAFSRASGRRTGLGCSTDIDAGIKVAVDLGAKVINLSLGTPAGVLDPESDPPHQAAARYAAAKGVILVAASGNSGREEVFYPAGLGEVIAVGSVDLRGVRSGFTTYGHHLSLSAPGERVLGVGRRTYRFATGTSHAAPFVAAAAALLASRARRLGRELSPAQARHYLEESARSTAGGHSHETGHGILDAAGALDLMEREWTADRKGGRG